MLFILYFLTLSLALPRYDISKDNYILTTIQDNEREMKIENILRSPTNFKHLPPIVSMPKKDQRTIPDGKIPHYVIDYAPLVHLYSEERYLPYDINKFVTNFHAEYQNGTVLEETRDGMNISTLSKLPKRRDIFLTSNSDFDADPEWITGVHNTPNLINGEIKDAPATLIVVDKGNGWVDAYWFYFYSFNLGPFVMGSD